MASANLSVPTTSALSPSERIASSNPSVFRILNKLSRPALLSLVLDWLVEENQVLSAPFLADENYEPDVQDAYPPSYDLDELREIYTGLMSQKGSKRDIVDRIIEGDWRHGVSLYQLAMADMQYLYDHPLSQKWTALKVVRLKTDPSDPDSSEPPSKDDELPSIPRFHPATFLQNLQREILPDVKAHYNIDRHPTLPMLLLRIYVLESPYNTSLALHSLSRTDTTAFETSKTIYVAFPDAAPYVYVSLATSAGAPGGASESRSLRKLVLDGIPKAFSRPRARYGLQMTSLAAKSLQALVERRGAGRTNAAGGGWGIYAEENKQDTPLNPVIPPAFLLGGDEKGDMPPPERPSGKGLKRVAAAPPDMQKRRKLVAQGRFGNSGKVDDGKGIDRLDVRLEEKFPALDSAEQQGNADFSDEEAGPTVRKKTSGSKSKKGRRNTIAVELERGAGEGDDEMGGEWRPDLRLTFHGQHIFAGVRKLVECGVVDGDKMPGWMTGEEGVSVGVVREGRIRGFKGSGL